MQQWQDIETAPNDGKPKLLIAPGWSWSRIGYRNRIGWWMDNTGLQRLADPTHWMPLPEPPQGRD